MSKASDTYVLDMQSDTNSKPTPPMYEAMVNAPVGNDSFHNDPTVNALEKKCADLFGKEDAMFSCSGTMSNLLAVMTHCDKRGSEYMTGDTTHLFMDEQGGTAQFAHVHTMPLVNLPDGTFDIEQMVERIRDATDAHFPETQLVCVENSNNFLGGRVLPLDFLEKMHTTAKKHGLPVHMDGSRLWSCAAYLNTDLKNITKFCDSVSACFSKSLSCPCGSILAGPKDFIARARRTRKGIGGTMRQTGVLAGAAIYAIDNHFPKFFHDDNRRAKEIAQGILDANHKECSIDMEGIHTNIFRLEINKPWNSAMILDRLKEVTEEERASLGDGMSLLLGPMDRQSVRFITFNGVTDDDVPKIVKKTNYVLREIFSKEP